MVTTIWIMTAQKELNGNNPDYGQKELNRNNPEYDGKEFN